MAMSGWVRWVKSTCGGCTAQRKIHLNCAGPARVLRCSSSCGTAAAGAGVVVAPWACRLNSALASVSASALPSSRSKRRWSSST